MAKAELTIVGSGDGKDIYLNVNGLRVAKRGRRGTAQARTWVPLEPGYKVWDESEKVIAVEYEGKHIQ